ncbi:MAG: MBL fold metallo-hydrolase [Phycisphaeraceae bacterium]
MIPREPARSPQMGYLYIPPYRVQGISIAGEQSVVHVPELGVCFDIGSAPKPVLTADYVALSHGHMDHAAAIAYYFSQRNFQGIGTGTLVCHPALEKPVRNVMTAWIDLEAQRTPYNVIALEPGEQIEIKNNIFLRGFATAHTVPSLGYVVIEKRSKLRPELADLPQERIVELKNKGEQVTHTLEIPLVCYTGDTMWGEHFERPDVLQSRIIITECTFLEPGHRSRAGVGKHLHLDDIINLLEASTAEAVVLTHLSRRTHIGQVRRALEQAIPARHQERVLVLMDSRTNRQRFERQLADAQANQGQR